MKSERLRKLENELKDLEQWLKLGLVPKKDIEKHKKEIESLNQRISEENVRLLYLKESGEEVEYTSTKRAQGQRQSFQETHTMPGADINTVTEQDGATESGYDASEAFEPDTTSFRDDTDETEERTSLMDEEEEDPYSDKNRWRRGILKDPDVDNW